MQYKKGDYVNYASSGVCLIEDIRNVACIGKDSMFYVLKPIKDKKSTVYVPVGNEVLTAKMRYIMTKTEIDDLLKSIKSSDISWIDDRKVRSQSFKTILKRGDMRELINLVSCIYLKKLEFTALGKHLSATDEDILSQAESMIDNEFCFVLKLDGKKTGEYIRSSLSSLN